MEIAYNILHADPDSSNDKSLCKTMDKKCRILPATSFEQCETLLKQYDIDVVILDLDLLEAEGIQLLDMLLTTSPKSLMILTGSHMNQNLLVHAVNKGCVFRYVQKPWEPNAMKQMVDLALETSVEKESQKLLMQDLESIIDEMKFLHELSQKISEKKPLPKLLNEIMESSKLLLNAEASSLLLYNPKEKKLDFLVATGTKGKTIKKFSMDLGIGIAGWVAKNKRPLLIEDCYKDPRFNPEYDKRSKFKTKSMICVPMIRKNQLLGVIEVINKKGGDIFKISDLALFETLASQCAIAIENHNLIERQIETEALERELETAREIQEMLLPTTLPHYDDIQLAAKLIPAKQVGGDYYNIIQIDHNRSLLFIADVTGKGIPAALIVSTIYSCLNSYLKFSQQNFDLMTLVTSMNRVLIESTTSTKFATCWFGLYFHNSKKLISLNAGHNPPYIFHSSKNRPFELTKGGLFLGGMDVPYQTEEIQLQKNDILVFFTDGVTEAWNKKEEEYGEDRLIDVVYQTRQHTAEMILTAIEQDVHQHVAQAQQSDDFTCAVVKIC